MRAIARRKIAELASELSTRACDHRRCALIVVGSSWAMIAAMPMRAWILCIALVAVCMPARADPPDAATKKSLIGKWEAVDAKGLFLEFAADGHYKESTAASSGALTGTYRWFDRATIEITLDINKQSPGLIGIALDGNDLALADHPSKGGKGKPDHYRRIK